MSHPPLPPFNSETAAQKARMAEDAWNTRDPAQVALAYTPDSRWRNRVESLQGRAEIEAFLTRKWSRELDYRLIKELWAFRENRIAVRFAYEWRDDSGHWFRSCNSMDSGSCGGIGYRPKLPRGRRRLRWRHSGGCCVSKCERFRIQDCTSGTAVPCHRHRCRQSIAPRICGGIFSRRTLDELGWQSLLAVRR